MTKLQNDHVICCFAKVTFATRHAQSAVPSHTGNDARHGNMLVLLLVVLLSVVQVCRFDPGETCNFLAGKTAGQRRPRQFRSLSKKCVPYFLASSDVLFGLASGMTIKFFPIFFLKQVALPPIGTNFILAGTPLCVAIMSQLASPIAQLIGEHPLHCF